MNSKNVIIIGDSISMGYTPLVKDLLRDHDIEIERVGGGDSAGILVGLSEWLAGKSPDLIQFNCGLHDARFFRYSQAYQQPIANYEAHLRGIVKWLKENTTSRLLWATTTPVITERITLDYIRYPADILAYNAVAKAIMDEAQIPINDLYAALAADSISDCLGPDGVHMTERGNAVLAGAVARAILAMLDKN